MASVRKGENKKGLNPSWRKDSSLHLRMLLSDGLAGAGDLVFRDHPVQVVLAADFASVQAVGESVH